MQSKNRLQLENDALHNFCCLFFGCLIDWLLNGASTAKTAKIISLKMRQKNLCVGSFKVILMNAVLCEKICSNQSSRTCRVASNWWRLFPPLLADLCIRYKLQQTETHRTLWPNSQLVGFLVLCLLIGGREDGGAMVNCRQYYGQIRESSNHYRSTVEICGSDFRQQHLLLTRGHTVRLWLTNTGLSEHHYSSDDHYDEQYRQPNRFLIAYNG